MIFICTYQAYLVRKVPENYNEARYITFTMVTVSMTIVVYIIIDSGMEGHNLELVYCIFQTVRTSIALGCMFFPKVYIILFQPEKNVPHDPFQSKLGTFVEDERTDKVEPDENACNSSSLDQSVSSANSNASCTTAVIGRSQRKVSAQTDNTNNSRASADSANWGGKRNEDETTWSTLHIIAFPNKFQPEGLSYDSFDSESSVFKNWVKEVYTRA